MRNILVSDVMTRNPVQTGINSSILDCAKKMVRKKVGGLIITDNKKLAGFISGQDILWALIKSSRTDLSEIKAVDISPKKIITIKSSATLQQALEKIKQSKFYRLPVVHNGEVVGMITIKDILGFYPEAYSELGELDFIREEAEKIKRIQRGHDDCSIPSGDGVCEECGCKGELYSVEEIMLCSSCLNLR
ncbi:MAG: CBS domain-containing protein [Nanoarchaeota archaeon]|nr:CBS domain-containing protein [Nanoarchaeota archaeon]